MRILGYTDFVEYRLASQFQGSVVIEEPINYEDGNDNIYERDKESKGFFTVRTNTLEFYNKGAEFLRRQINNRGVAEPVLLRKFIKDENRLDQEWRLVSESYIDMHTLSFDESNSTEGIAKANAQEGGLKQIIESKKSDDFDLTATEDFDGNDIGSLPTKEILLEPKKIFLRSRLEVDPGSLLKPFTVTGGDNDDGRPIPYTIDFESDDNIENVRTQVLRVANEDYAQGQIDSSASYFYVNPTAGIPRTIVLNGSLEIEKYDGDYLGGPPDGRIEIALLRYTDGDALNFGGRIELNTGGDIMAEYSGLIPNGVTLSYTFANQEVTVLPGEKITVGVLGQNLDDGIKIKVNQAFLEITEDSAFPPTTAKAVTYFEAANRLVQLISGRSDAVISDLLTTGTLSTKLITQGFWVRGFPDVVKEGTDEERRIQFIMSMKALLEDINLHEPCAWWIEKGADDLEYLRIEAYSYTQQGFIGVRYGNQGETEFEYTPASDVERNVLGDNFFSSITIGSSKGGDNYEEVYGLQSIQGQAEYGTVNKNSESKYTVLSPFRLGDIDVEIPRRKPYSSFPDEDTRFDSDKIVLDCKILNGTYYIKKWDDSFADPPTGLYDYDSAYNLEHTPARFILKHGSIINSGLYHYPNEVLRFQSSNCNSAFKSRKDGENTLSEGENISHTLLNAPYVRPWGVNLSCPVTQEIEDSITGKTEEIQNWFGLVAVEIRGNIEYFRLIKADVNGEGKHELVEAFLG